MQSFSFVVLADSHIRSENESNPTYLSDRSANARHAYAVRKIKQIAPAFVIHLGDVVHPIPALASHDAAPALRGHQLAAEPVVRQYDASS